MNKATPGPYSVDKPVTITINGHDHVAWPIYSDHGADGNFDGTGVAVVIMPLQGSIPEDRTEREATAAVLAASWDLLEALRALLDSLDTPLLDKDSVSKHERACDAARLALQKAQPEGVRG